MTKADKSRHQKRISRVLIVAGALLLATMMLVTIPNAHVAFAHAWPAAGGDGSGGAGDDAPAWPFAVATIVAVGLGALWAIRRRP